MKIPSTAQGKESTMKTALSLVLAVLLLTGCATVKDDIASGKAATNAKAVASTALGLGSMAAPQYASAIAQIQKLLAAPDKSSAVDGFEFSRTFRYRGTICEAQDITWEDAWTRISAADSGIPAPVSTTSTVSVASGNSSDTELRNEIRAIVEAAGLGEEAQ